MLIISYLNNDKIGLLILFYFILIRLKYIQIASFCARLKYYIVWLLAEGACILSGLGFNGYDEQGNAKW
jgi:lysophospholipid acyltransferase